MGLGTGPLWANDSGTMLYARRGATGRPALALRTGPGVEDVAVEGDANDFYVGLSRERWDQFVSGTVNAQDEIAFVAATKIPDDPATPQNEAISRRGVYARAGNTLFEIARFGGASPVVDPLDGPVPWGTVFDAVTADSQQDGFLRVVFSGQLAGADDRRSGLFRWSEEAPSTVTPAVLTGDLAPSGGSYSSFGRLRGNGAGDVLFFAVTQVTPESPQVPGLFLLRADGSQARIVKFGTSGDAAPGGGSFGIAADFDLADSGDVVLAATLADGPANTGLFRAEAPAYTTSLVVSQGDATPIQGTYGSFAQAAVRSAGDGTIVFSVPLSDDIGGDGIFSVAPGSVTPAPLVTTQSTLALAPLGADRAVYSTEDQIRVVVPADGTEQGPTDFRVAKLDVRNAVPRNADSIKFEGSFLLPPWTSAPPATFRADVARLSPTQSFTGAALAKIAEVKVSVSASPGNNFVFGLGGTDAAPTGTVRFNGQAQTLKKLAIASDGTAATWTFAGSPGPGSFTIDLEAGTFRLKVNKATIQPSYDAANFRVALFLRSAEDVSAARPDNQSYFAEDLRLAASQPNFGRGRRVTSDGAGTPGGTVYVSSLRVTRKPAKRSKPAGDTIQLAVTLRLCPGSSPPATPSLPVTLRLGSFRLDGVLASRVGRSSKYRYTAPGVSFQLDLAKATLTVKAATSLLPELLDPTPGSATNTSDQTVGGMTLDFELSIPRVYEVAYPVPVQRLKGGRVFVR